MRALDDLQQQGKIKEIGVSNVNLKELKEYNINGKVRFIQNRFSLINRSIDAEFEEYLLSNKIGLIPYQVIDRGQLTGSVIDGIKLREGDLRAGRADWSSDKYELIADWSKKHLQPVAKKLGITLGQLSIAWALHQSYLSFVIVGATQEKYVTINLQADSISLDQKTLQEIEDAYALLEKEVEDKFGVTVREFRGLNEKYS